jgi:hypothetical protein
LQDLTPLFASRLAGGFVFLEEPGRIDPAEVLADELVGLAVLDALVDEATLVRTHLLFFGLSLDSGITPPAKQAIPKARHGRESSAEKATRPGFPGLVRRCKTCPLG